MHHKTFWFFGLVFVLSASVTAPLPAQVCPQDLACNAYVGSIGVGTDNPVAELHVVGAPPFPGTGVISSGIGSEVIGSGTQFTVELNAGDIIVAGGQARIVQSITSDIVLTVVSPFSPTVLGFPFTIQQPITRLDDSAGTNRFMVNGLGNVGIGTTTPQATLDVNGLAAFSGRVGIGTTNPKAKLDVRGTGGTNAGLWVAGDATPSNQELFVVNLATPNVIRLQANRASTVDVDTGFLFTTLSTSLGNVDIMTLTPNGNVGIGTTDPRTKLDVQGGDFSVSRSSASNAEQFSIGGNTPDVIRLQASRLRYPLIDTHLQFATVTTSGNVDVMRLTSSGTVGIGTTSPAPGFRLDVAGPAHASSFPTSSDIRLKKNVTPLTGVLDKLEKIRGVSFDWNERYEALGRSTGHREIGVIAQEVEGVFPELITTWGDESYRAVDYGRLTGVLIEAVKELKAENETLKRRIEVLESK